MYQIILLLVLFFNTTSYAGIYQTAATVYFLLCNTVASHTEPIKAEQMFFFPGKQELKNCLDRQLTEQPWFAQNGIITDMTSLLAGKRIRVSTAQATAQNTIGLTMLEQDSYLIGYPPAMESVSATIDTRTKILIGALQGCQIPPERFIKQHMTSKAKRQKKGAASMPV